MQTSDFFYELPQELIAQTPLEPRFIKIDDFEQIRRHH